MNTRKNRSGETSDAHPKEWLDLSLGPYIGHTRPTTSMKEYTCSFCGRNFYSHQALGGHQNGHRRERDAIRRYCARAFQMHQSIDVHSNVLVGKPVRDLVTNVARFSDHEDGFGVACVQPYAEEESVDLKWPGSFYFNPQPASQQYDPSLLDLNLKL